MKSTDGNRLARISRVLQVVCSLSVFSVPLVIGVIWFFGTENFLLSGEATHYMVPFGVSFDEGMLSLSLRLQGFLISMLPGAVVTYGLWHLAKLFQNFSQLEFFTMATVRHFRIFATTVLLSGILYPIAGALMSLITTSGNSVGPRFVSVTFGDAELVSLFLGVVLLVITWVMEQGRMLAEENQQFV